MWNNNIAIGIAVYNPDEKIMRNLENYNNAECPIIFYLNSPIATTSFHDINMIGDCKNNGLSVAINSIAKSAHEMGCSHFLFLDQDTVCDLDGLLSEIRRNLDQFPSNIIAIHLNSKRAKIYKEGEFIINSSTVFNLVNFFHIGGMSKDYFVDGLDYDFCIRSWQSTYMIQSLPFAKYFDHHSGQDGINIKIGGISLNIRKYPASRYKEINRFYINSLKMCCRVKSYRAGISLCKSYCIFLIGRIISSIKWRE